MRYQSTILAFVMLAFVCNAFTFFLFLSSDFWSRPLSAQASSDGTFSLTITAPPSNATNDSGGSGESSGGGSSSGGGGGGAGIPVALFTIDPEELNIGIVAGALEERIISVHNTGSAPVTIAVSLTGVASFVSLDSSSITLEPGASGQIRLTIRAPESGIYGGRVVFSSAGERKEAILLLNVHSANALFDVSLTVPESMKVLRLGKVLKAFISLQQVGPAEDTDVTATYTIKDFDGVTLFTETETFRVLHSKSYLKEFDTRGLKEGDYLVGIEIVYPQGFATASAYFSVSTTVLDYSLIALIALFVLSLLILFYSFRTYRKAKQLRGSQGLVKRRAL